MSSTLNVIITDAGIAEVVNAQHTGTAPVVLTQVGFGRGIYTPTADQAALHDEIKRVSTIAGGVVGSNIMHIQALDSGEDAYAVYEIGVYTASGTLFAVYSQPLPILHKVANSSIMCVIDFVLSGVEPTDVTVGDTDYTLAPATTTNQGVVELATDSETIAGTDEERAVTPAAGAAAYVALRGNQTVAGQKSFTDGIAGNLTGNVTGNVTGDLTGKIPRLTRADGNLTIPVGSIFLARVFSSIVRRIHAGYTMLAVAGDPDQKIYVYVDNGGSPDKSDTEYVGSFVALSEANFTTANSYVTLLLMRVA